MHHTSKFDWTYLLLFVVGSIVFSLGVGRVHLFDWDEANFAEAAREMLLTKDWLQVKINFEPFWEKPPLFIWLQAISMSLFGINEFAARLPNALIGGATLCVLYTLGSRVANRKMGLIWALLYAASWLPHFYFKTAIIDPLFNLLIFLSVSFLASAFDRKTLSSYLWAGLFLGLAVLTKGPAAGLIVGLCIVLYIVLFRGWKLINWMYLIVFGITTLVTTFLWFGVDIIKNGLWFTENFIVYQIRLFSTQDAGHGGPFFYHFVVLLIGCFPASVFFFQYTFNQTKRNLELEGFNINYGRWMQLLLWSTLIIFSIVKTKIVHYSSLCYFPLTFIAAREVYLWLENKKDLKRITQILFYIIGLLLAVAIALFPVAGIKIDSWKHLVKDQFTAANLEANVVWSYWEVLFGISVLLVLIVFIWKSKSSRNKAFWLLVFGQIVIIELAVFHFTPKVEVYSQGSAIAYYQSIAGEEDQYIFPVGFKSYAYLFYSEKKAPQTNTVNPTSAQVVIDKIPEAKVFLVAKNIYKAKLEEEFPNAELLNSQNGYLLYRIERSGYSEIGQ